MDIKTMLRDGDGATKTALTNQQRNKQARQIKNKLSSYKNVKLENLYADDIEDYLD